jgi:hypothetical protein
MAKKDQDRTPPGDTEVPDHVTQAFKQQREAADDDRVETARPTRATAKEV